MKWKPLSNKACFILALPVIAPIVMAAAVGLAPALLIVIPLKFIGDKIYKARFPDPTWHDWYAWRPIKTDVWEGDGYSWVWLETIQRMVSGYGWGCVYRLKKEANHDPL